MCLLDVLKVKSHLASNKLRCQSAMFCYGGKFMSPASMTELIQSRQQNKSGLVLSIKIMVCPDLTNHEILFNAWLSLPSGASGFTGFLKSSIIVGYKGIKSFYDYYFYETLNDWLKQLWPILGYYFRNVLLVCPFVFYIVLYCFTILFVMAW